MKSEKYSKVTHLVENWDKYKLETYPWGKDIIDQGRQGRERAIVDEMKRRGLVEQNIDPFDINIDVLIAEAKTKIMQKT